MPCLRVKHCAVNASQSAGLDGDLGTLGKWASVLGDWTDRVPDDSFHSFQERLDLVECRPRQITESWSYGAQCFQASVKDWDQRSSEINCGTGHGKPLEND